MRKIFFLFAVVLLLSLNAYSQYDDEDTFTPKSYIYVVGALEPTIKTVDFFTFDLYDHSDDRVIIDLASKEKNAPTFGLAGGYWMGFTKRLAWIAELHLSGGNGFVLDLFGGANFDFLSKDNFCLGVAPKIGFAYVSKKLGNAQIDPNSGANNVLQVNMDDHTVYPDDDLSTSVLGFAYQLGLSSQFQLTNNLRLIAQLGWRGALLKDMDIRVYNPDSEEGFNVDFASKYCVERGTAEHIDFTPVLKRGGIYFNVGVMF